MALIDDVKNIIVEQLHVTPEKVTDTAHFVDRGPDDGEVEALAAADVAVEDFADVKTQIHVGRR